MKHRILTTASAWSKPSFLAIFATPLTGTRTLQTGMYESMIEYESITLSKTPAAKDIITHKVYELHLQEASRERISRYYQNYSLAQCPTRMKSEPWRAS